MLILPLCEVRSLFGVMTFVQHRKCILAARNRLHLREKNSWPLLFLRFGLPKPRYARFWQLSNLRKSNFGREFFSLRATWFWLLRTFILWRQKEICYNSKFFGTVRQGWQIHTLHLAMPIGAGVFGQGGSPEWRVHATLIFENLKLVKISKDSFNTI